MLCIIHCVGTVVLLVWLGIFHDFANFLYIHVEIWIQGENYLLWNRPPILQPSVSQRGSPTDVSVLRWFWSPTFLRWSGARPAPKNPTLVNLWSAIGRRRSQTFTVVARKAGETFKQLKDNDRSFRFKSSCWCVSEVRFIILGFGGLVGGRG